jgi:hypothetical protein
MIRELVQEGRTLLESSMRHMLIYKARNGKWYLELAQREHGEREDADLYGPFTSKSGAEQQLEKYANPGYRDYDTSGKKPIPKAAPNGSRIQKPR